MNEPKVTVRPEETVPRDVVVVFYGGEFGTYDPRTQHITISLVKPSNPVEKTAEIINHEYLHYILHKEVGIKASAALDNIDGREKSLYREFN